jgi:elongation factor Ts
MAVTTELVKQLRDKTGISMMACKKALEEAKGDIPSAIELLRKQGQATAAKRSGKQASEGQVQALVQGGLAALAEINCETDFVATNQDFIGFVNGIMQLLIKCKPTSVEALKATSSEIFKNRTVNNALEELVAKCGEKLGIERIALVSAAANQVLFSYVHGKGRVAVVVVLEGEPAVLSSEAAKVLGKDLCLQVCSANPSFIKREEISASVIEKEKEIYRELSLKEGKPEKILDKIVNGKLEKYFQDVVLMEQLFIKETTMAVKSYLAQQEKLAGGGIRVAKFVRFQLGDRG